MDIMKHLLLIVKELTQILQVSLQKENIGFEKKNKALPLRL